MRVKQRVMARRGWRLALRTFFSAIDVHRAEREELAINLEIVPELGFALPGAL